MEEVSNATTIPDFNPSGNPAVSGVKNEIENLIKFIKYNDRFKGADERCRAIAITKLEEASMWAVKSLFVGNGNGRS